MASTTSRISCYKNKYKLSRRGKKLSIIDNSKVLTALPKDISERTWAEILEKEENDLLIFDIREEILENALRIGYLHYMEKQNITFTVHCAAKAWLKLVDWYFYRHDPGEDVSASPSCFIPKRAESWQPDEPPEPSPRDAFCRQRLKILEDESTESLRDYTSSTSLDYPIVEEIPEEFWFPGKVNLKTEMESEESRKTDITQDDVSGTSLSTSEDNLVAGSEVLQRVTDYSAEQIWKEESPKVPCDKRVSAVVRSSAAGGSGDAFAKSCRTRRSHVVRQVGPSTRGRSKATLPPLTSASRSRASIISDCRLRNLRVTGAVWCHTEIFWVTQHLLWADVALTIRFTRLEDVKQFPERCSAELDLSTDFLVEVGPT